MIFRYSAYDEDFINSYKIEGNHLDADDLGYVAEECAEDYHSNHDGWEAGWPLDFFIFDEEGKLLGTFEVNRGARPVFTSYEKKPTATEQVECQHSWEHLHGTDPKNEYRCSKCGERKP